MYKSKADIIILGSSRAQHHYIPEILSDSLNMTVFNLGSGGQNIYYDYAAASTICRRYSPKIIILDLFGIDYEKTDERYSTGLLSVLLPYYKDEASVREVIGLRGINERLKLLSQVYPFNSELTGILYSFIKKGVNPNLKLNGYIPIYGNLVQSPDNSDGRIPEIDSLKIKYLQKLFTSCKEKRIELIVIESPKFNNAEPSFFNNELHDLCSKYSIEFWDFTNHDDFLRKPDLFKDNLHLNFRGAELYTRLIASKIKTYLNANSLTPAEVIHSVKISVSK